MSWITEKDGDGDRWSNFKRYLRWAWWSCFIPILAFTPFYLWQFYKTIHHKNKVLRDRAVLAESANEALRRKPPTPIVALPKKSKEFKFKIKFGLKGYRDPGHGGVFPDRYILPDERSKPFQIYCDNGYYTLDILNEEEKLTNYDIVLHLGKHSKTSSRYSLKKSTEWQETVNTFNFGGSSWKEKPLKAKLVFIYDGDEFPITFPAVPVECKWLRINFGSSRDTLLNSNYLSYAILLLCGALGRVTLAL